MKHTLVVPTNRKESCLTFLRSWKNQRWDIYVIEDGPEITIDHDIVFCWKDIENEFGEYAWSIFSRQDSAIRCYGLYKAWKDGADFVYSLDDDCFCETTPGEFIDQHLENFLSRPKWTESYIGIPTRGIPYENTGRYDHVIAGSMGLWTNNLDFDSIQELTICRTGFVEPATPKGTRVMPIDHYFPFCGMNFCIQKQTVPLAYFPLMGLESPYKRFDDIWCGIVMQKVCQRLNWGWVCGQPVVEHRRASNPFTNLTKEAAGIVANEKYWQIIDKIELKETTPIDCMKEIGEALRNDCVRDTYIRQWGEGIIKWVKLFGG